MICLSVNLFAQSDPVLKIDTSRVVFKAGLSFPYWLNSGQTVKKESNVKTISVLEFALDTIGNLRLSKPLSIISSEEQIVPDGKVWKIEALGMNENLTGGSETSTGPQTTSNFSNSIKPTIITSPKIFSTPGTYSWRVPPDIKKICVEIWGGGGNGGYNYQGINGLNYAGAGGGGGGFGYQCLDVTPLTTYTIIVGESGQSSSFGSFLIATGGQSGIRGDLDPIPGLAGSSNAFYNLEGEAGGKRGDYRNGGIGANGGNGGVTSWNGGFGTNGTHPGGGGSGGGAINYNYSNIFNGGIGAAGQVIIYW